MYKLNIFNIAGKPVTAIVRLADNAFIPEDLTVADYAEYLRWIEAGNTPLPADNLTTNQGA